MTRCVLEDVDEGMTNDASLLFGILDAREGVEELRRRIDGDELDAEVCAKSALYLIALVEAEQAGVDEDAGKLIANRAVNERCRDRRIHTARQSADRTAVADDVSYLCNFVIDEGARRPRRCRATHLEEKVREHLAPARCVRDLGMELHPIPGLRFVTERRNRRAVAAREAQEATRERAHLIAMAHPGHEWLPHIESLKQRAAVTAQEYLRASVFAAVRRSDIATVQVRDEIHPVADAKDRRDLERCWLRGRNVLAVDRVWPTAEDYPGRRPLSDPVDRARRRMDLGIDARF